MVKQCPKWLEDGYNHLGNFLRIIHKNQMDSQPKQMVVHVQHN